MSKTQMYELVIKLLVHLFLFLDNVNKHLLKLGSVLLTGVKYLHMS